MGVTASEIELAVTLAEIVPSAEKVLLTSTGKALVSGYGSVFVGYFMTGPARTYDDLLRNDANMFIGYRRRLLEHGIFELPLNLKRSHVSYAHTDADADHLLEAAAAAAKLARSDVLDLTGASTMGGTDAHR